MSACDQEEKIFHKGEKKKRRWIIEYNDDEQLMEKNSDKCHDNDNVSSKKKSKKTLSSTDYNSEVIDQNTTNEADISLMKTKMKKRLKHSHSEISSQSESEDRQHKKKKIKTDSKKILNEPKEVSKNEYNKACEKDKSNNLIKPKKAKEKPQELNNISSSETNDTMSHDETGTIKKKKKKEYDFSILKNEKWSTDILYTSSETSQHDPSVLNDTFNKSKSNETMSPKRDKKLSDDDNYANSVSKKEKKKKHSEETATEVVDDKIEAEEKKVKKKKKPKLDTTIDLNDETINQELEEPTPKKKKKKKLIESEDEPVMQEEMKEKKQIKTELSTSQANLHDEKDETPKKKTKKKSKLGEIEEELSISNKDNLKEDDNLNEPTPKKRKKKKLNLENVENTSMIDIGETEYRNFDGQLINDLNQKSDKHEDSLTLNASNLEEEEGNTPIKKNNNKSDKSKLNKTPNSDLKLKKKHIKTDITSDEDCIPKSSINDCNESNEEDDPNNSQNSKMFLKDLTSSTPIKPKIKVLNKESINKKIDKTSPKMLNSSNEEEIQVLNNDVPVCSNILLTSNASNKVKDVCEDIIVENGERRIKLDTSPQKKVIKTMKMKIKQDATLDIQSVLKNYKLPEEKFEDYYKELETSLSEKEITAAQHKNLFKDFSVMLPFEIPPSHRIETRISSCATPAQKLQFEQLSIKMKTGAFTKDEDNIIKDNWKQFCKVHNWDEDNQEAFMNMKIGPNSYTLPQKDRLNFVRFLGHNLPNRQLFSIYMRFLRLFKQNSKVAGRFTEEEDKLILSYIEEHSKGKNAFSELAIMLKRNRDNVQKRYTTLMAHKENPNLDEETRSLINNPEYIKRFIKAVLIATAKKSVSELKNLYLSCNHYDAIAKTMNETKRLVKHFWLTTLYPRMFIPTNITIHEIKDVFIHKLKSLDCKYWKDIEWSDIASEIPGATSAFAHKVIYTLVYRYVRKEDQNNLKECILCLDQAYAGDFEKGKKFRKIVYKNDEVRIFERQTGVQISDNEEAHDDDEDKNNK